MIDTLRLFFSLNQATEFTVTEGHLKLLRHTCDIYWDPGEGYGAPAINPKKPYGNSAVPQDVANILQAPGSDWESAPDWDEDFDTTADGQPAIEHPEPGEVVWRDDRGVTCRRWNWRQCVRTRITHSTTTAMFVLDGLSALGVDGLRAAEAELTESLARLSPGATFASRLLGP